jgi:PhzF family phenazine biosynthesis protein
VAALGLNSGEVVDSAWVDNGPGWLAIALADPERLLGLTPGFAPLDIGVVAPYPAGGPVQFEVRAFFPVAGTLREDPVTGSLNASLAQWMLETGTATPPYVAAQGKALGRDGRVFVDRDQEQTIWVGGDSVTCVDGNVEI